MERSSRLHRTCCAEHLVRLRRAKRPTKWSTQLAPALDAGGEADFRRSNQSARLAAAKMDQLASALATASWQLNSRREQSPAEN